MLAVEEARREPWTRRPCVNAGWPASSSCCVPPSSCTARTSPSGWAGRPRGWWDAYADTLSSGYASLIRTEAGSRSLQCYCALVPHALLQTPAYTRHLVRTSWRNPSVTEVDRRVQVCRRRQDLLDPAAQPHPLRLSAVVDESVLLRTPAGADGADVLRGQLEHLVTVAAWPHVTLQVLPFAAGLAAVTAGSFSVLESLGTRAQDVVYLENKTRIFFIESESESETEVHGYAQDFDLLTRLALSPDDSPALLRSLVQDQRT